MAQLVYVLCAATAFICALLLLRGYRRSRAPLLLWASLCFVGLTANNILLYVDLVVVPSVDLALWRHLIALVSLSLLVFGFIWDGTSVMDAPAGRRSGEDR
jgi:hypothetical protein